MTGHDVHMTVQFSYFEVTVFYVTVKAHC